MCEIAPEVGGQFGLEKLLEAMKAAVIATRLDGQILYCNRFAERLYGWPAQEIIGRNIVEVVVPAGEVPQATEIMLSLNAGKDWTGEFRVKRKDGSSFSALVTDSPIFDEKGILIGIIGVSRDITPFSQVRQELERRVRERTAELQVANDNLRDLSARLMKVRDEEGRRLARGLHDSVGQLVVAIGMDLRLIKAQANKLDATGQSALAETEVLLQQVNSEIRTISHLLHPPLLEDLGLLPALRSYVARFSDRSHIKADLQIPSEFDRLPGDMEIAVFRIVQECLTNIHRHSRATRAEVIIHCQGEGVVVQVHDNGCGISRNQLAELTASGTAGVGLTGIGERVRQLNGTLEIKSDKTGTAVIASLPLTRSNAAAG